MILLIFTYSVHCCAQYSETIESKLQSNIEHTYLKKCRFSNNGTGIFLWDAFICWNRLSYDSPSTAMTNILFQKDIYYLLLTGVMIPTSALIFPLFQIVKGLKINNIPFP